MKNIKNNVSFLFLVSSILLIHHNHIKAGGSGAGFGVKAMEMFVAALPSAATVRDVAGNVGVNAGVSAVQKAGELLPDAATASGVVGNLGVNAGVNAIQKAGEFMPSAETAEKVMKNAGAGLGSEVAKKLEPIGWAFFSVYALSEVGKTVKGVKSFFWPCAEESQKKVLYARAYKRAQAEDTLRASLINNANGQRGALGIPIECENDARELVKVDGCAELKKAIEDFKFLYGESSC